MLVLTNCTFDGHVANVERTMLECLAIKPDLIFLWDEAWFGFARFSPFLRRRTAMGAAAKLRDDVARHPRRTRKQASRQIQAKALLPDPDKVRLRVYETDSVHKSMSSLRQGSIIVVADQDFHTVEASFKEAFFTHTSTSPNLQIIASLDVARRQMELEGYELVQRAIQLAIEMRREINQHPLISKYFKAADAGRDDPGRVPQVGFSDYGQPGWTLDQADRRAATTTSSSSTRRASRCCAATPATTARSSRRCSPSEYDIQINKTSRNSVLVQININNTRSDLAHLIKALADMARAIDKRLAEGGEAGAGRVQGARQVAGRGRARPAELQPLPRRVPRQPEEQDRRRPHARGVLPRLRRGGAAST